MNTTAKKILAIAVKIATGLLIAFTVFMMIFTIVTVTTVGRNDRNIFGVRFYIVQTDSMSLSEKNKDLDVHFNAGDIIIVKKAKDATALQPGDIISFMSTNSESYGETVTHMIRNVQKNDAGKVEGYVTYGTNTGTDDEALVEPEYVLGVYIGKLPGVGNFFAFVKSTPGYIVCILVPFLLLILYNGVNVIRLFRQYKREQMESLQAERDKIDAERAENQRMMQELLELKAQLEQQSKEKAPLVKPAPDATVTKKALPDRTVEIKSEDQTISPKPASEEVQKENVTTDEVKTKSEGATPAKTTDENQKDV